MARNIEMNYKTSSGSYEVLYPMTTTEQIENLEELRDSFVTKQALIENGIASYFWLQSWEAISRDLQSGNTGNYTIGSYKPIILNGTAGPISFNNTQAYAVIIGINHNSSREGNNRLHLQISLNSENTQLLGNARMNTTNTNVGGWTSSYMRQTVCSQFYNCLPSALRSVIKSTTKYTSAGNQSTSITSTNDNIFLLSEYEVFGTTTYSVAGESNYQKQYEWYKTNGKIKYTSNDTNSASRWWERSPQAGGSSAFCLVSNDGTASNTYVSPSNGFAPCLCI